MLETLISLAILSVVSLALFQSTSSLLRITDRAVNAGERALETAVSRKTFRASVHGLTPGWAEEPQNIFKGGPASFSGLSTDVPILFSQSRQLFSYEIVQQEGRQFALKVEAGGRAWILQEFSADHAEFSYLGSDQKWYESWPPQTKPRSAFFDDTRYMTTPQLPLAIRLHGEDRQDPLDWVAMISGPYDLPYREKS